MAAISKGIFISANVTWHYNLNPENQRTPGEFRDSSSVSVFLKLRDSARLHLHRRHEAGGSRSRKPICHSDLKD